MSGTKVRKNYADDFAEELTEICRKHGIGIAGEPTLYILEEEDKQYRYAVGKDGRLVFV